MLKQNTLAGVRYQAAAKLAHSGKVDEALGAFQAIAAEGPIGYALLARLKLAGDAAKAGKPEEAVAAYDALAKDGSVDPLFKDFARLQAAALKLDSADWTEMQNRLNDLLGEQNAWRFSARELLGLAAYRAGKLDEARHALGVLTADPKVPPAIRERAGYVMSMVAASELARQASPGGPGPTDGEAAKAAPGKGAPAKSDGSKK